MKFYNKSFSGWRYDNPTANNIVPIGTEGSEQWKNQN
jgi:hypothetical protein